MDVNQAPNSARKCLHPASTLSNFLRDFPDIWNAQQLAVHERVHQPIGDTGSVSD